MEWHDLQDANDPQLDHLAAQYQLHPLHIEDCRHRGQNAKVEEHEHYLFVVLKVVEVEPDDSFRFTDFDLFLGRDFLITVREGPSPTLQKILDPLRPGAGQYRADQLFYRITDAVVDAYRLPLDQLDEITDALEDEVLESPSAVVLDRIFRAKRTLIELRRVLANTRDVASHLQRTQSDLISRDLWPFLRDVYDHVARSLDTIEVQRDLLSGALDIYLTGVSQRTNQVMKVLTVLGTIALPSLIVSGFYGMNLHGLPWSDSPYGLLIAGGGMLLLTVLLLVLLKILRWI